MGAMSKIDSIDNYRRNLIVAGKAERTVKSYCRSVRQLMEHYRCDPASLTEKQVRDYLVHCRDVKGWNHWTLKIALTSLKFYYTHGDGTSWNIWDFAKPPRYKPEIAVLTMREVRAIIGQIQLTHLRVCVSLMASCGLRVSEVVSVGPRDLSQREGHLLVRAGKGKKDRYVPLPEVLVPHLRELWKTHRNATLLFPGGRGRQIERLRTTTIPMTIATVQRIVKLGAKEARIHKTVTPHTFRHSYATNMLEEGINVRLLADYLGHADLQATLRYLHLTPSAQKKGYSIAQRMVFI